MADENKTGPRLVATNDERELRQRRAQEVVEANIRRLAANILRVIRGAGDPISIVPQCHAVVEAFVSYQDDVGHWPDAYIAQAALLLPDPVVIGRDEPERVYALHKITRGALQIVASELLGQRTQIAAGSSEMHDGLREHHAWRNELRRRETTSAAAPSSGGKKAAYGPRRVTAKRKTTGKTKPVA